MSDLRAQVWNRDGGICGLCGNPADPNRWHMDHKVPRDKGGANDLNNLQVSHPACNTRKGRWEYRSGVDAQVGISLSFQQYEYLRRRAFQERTTITQLIREMIDSARNVPSENE